MASGRLVDYLGHGDAADRPATPSLVVGGIGVWWSDDTSELSVWDGTAWQEDVGGGAGVSDGDKGDITVSASGATYTIDNDVVTYAKMQNVSAASKLLGRGSASGSGDAEEITVGSGLTMTGTTLSASGGSSIIAQIVQTQSNTGVNSGGATIPLDNTIPQNTEGAEFTQIATTFTPTNSSNILDIEVFISQFALTTNANAIGALFVDSTANALAAVNSTPAAAAYGMPMVIKYSEVAASTSARTYKFRYGGNGGTMYINSRGDGLNLGGVIYSHMKITERTP